MLGISRARVPCAHRSRDFCQSWALLLRQLLLRSAPRTFDGLAAILGVHAESLFTAPTVHFVNGDSLDRPCHLRHADNDGGCSGGGCRD